MYSRPVGLRLVIFIGSALGVGALQFMFAMAMAFVGLDIVSMEVLLYIPTLAMYGWLNTKVGYRWFDCFMLLIPVFGLVYSIKIWWRMTNLPHADWTANGGASVVSIVESKQLRADAYNQGIQVGVPPQVSDLVANALYPIEDAFPASAAFTFALRGPIEEFGGHVGNMHDYNEIGRLALATLHRYIHLARFHGDQYYAQRLQHVIDSNMPARRQVSA